jgi:hypothetical protein
VLTTVVPQARVAALCVAHGTEAPLMADRDSAPFRDLPKRNPFPPAWL